MFLCLFHEHCEPDKITPLIMSNLILFQLTSSASLYAKASVEGLACVTGQNERKCCRGSEESKSPEPRLEFCVVAFLE